MTKQKSLRKIFEWIIIYCSSIAGGNVPYLPLHGPNHLQSGVPKAGGRWGGYIPPIIWLYSPNNLSMVYICIPPTNLTLVCIWAHSSVAKGGYTPPLGLSTKLQNKKNTTFLALLRLFFALELITKWFKASFKTYIRGGGGGDNCQTNQWKLLKMPQNKKSNLIASVKMPNIGFIHKYIINSEIRGGGLFSVS